VRIIFIRHGMTAGNLEKRYIGLTDEPLCQAGEEALKAVEYPSADVVICSPMKRCTASAEIIYPGISHVLIPSLRECSFGEFEGKNYKELSGDLRYQQWIDSGGEGAFPGGELPEDFRRRCCQGFIEAAEKYSEYGSLAFVVHGGTIMSVLSRYAVPHRDYFQWHCENGRGYVCCWDGEKITDTESL